MEIVTALRSRVETRIPLLPDVPADNHEERVDSFASCKVRVVVDGGARAVRPGQYSPPDFVGDRASYV
jgi:thiamine pyrophosphokinase